MALVRDKGKPSLFSNYTLLKKKTEKKQKKNTRDKRQVTTCFS